MTSRYPLDNIARHGVLDGGVLFLEKPFSLHNLVAVFRKILDESRS